MTATLLILKMLEKNRKTGLNARQIWKAVGGDICNIRSQLSQMVKKRLIYIDGNAECRCCGAMAYCYRIDFDGRRMLHD